MNLTEVFIRRPVLSATLVIAMTVFGAMGYMNLPVASMPQVEYPTLAVNAVLPGADPKTMASSVATPLERQFSAIEGLRSMNSSSTLGMTSITLQFDLSRNIDAAAMDVQAAISRASGDLPSNMPSPPMYQKVNPSQVPIYFLIMTSDAMPLYKVTEYATSFVTDRLNTVPGVAQILDYSQKTFAVRVRLNPEILAARQIPVAEVMEGVMNQNVYLPVGSLDGKNRSRTVTASGQIMKAKDYEPIIVRYSDGQPVRLGDLGAIENSVINDKITCFYNGKPCVALAVTRQPGTNTVEIVNEIERRLPAIRASLPPTVKLEVMYDMSQSIRRSINDVKFTLVLAISLVVIVVLFFLRSVAATIIASVAIPLSLLFTFAGMYLFGFSLDNLSLVALVLAVGFVIDDAIVVLENIVRHVQMGEKPYQAAVNGAREIVFTILSMTASLAVVFVPIMFMTGMYGRILREFAVTITIAIIVSGVVAICITPAMSSRLLRSSGIPEETSRFFKALLSAYRWSLECAMRHRVFTLLFAIGLFTGTIYLFILIPKDFMPHVDMNYVQGISVAQQGISPKAMEKSMTRIGALIQSDRNVRSVLLVSGFPQSNQGFLVPILNNIPPRKESAREVIGELMPVVNTVPGMLTFFQVPPLIRVSTETTVSPYQLVLQSANTDVLFAKASEFSNKLRGLPQLTGAHSNLYLQNPEAYVSVDRDKASSVGISAGDIEDALFSAYSERQISDIYGTTNTYKVVLQVGKDYQEHLDQLSHLYVAGRGGELSRLDTLVKVTPKVGPLSVNHYDQLPSVTTSFNTAPGYSLGQATKAVRELAEKVLPSSIIFRFSGSAEAFEKSVKNMEMLIVIAIIVIYLILSVLYESLLVPLTIISGLPSAAFGGLLVLWIAGMPLDLFGYVGIFMLIGIVKKNAIMVVDFARDAERDDGMNPEQAAIHGSLVRFRPILMTTMAAIVGMAPIALAYGAGGEARQPLGLAVVGGLLVSQVVTLYLTPVVYSYLASIQEWIDARGTRSRELRGIPQ